MKEKKFHIIYISIIVILLLVIIGELYYFNTKRQTMHMGIMRSGMHMNGGKRLSMGGMSMTAVTPPPLSSQQSEQLTAGTDSAAIKKIFNITGGNFYFVPNKITVNKGDQVTFIFTNAGGVHDLVIDELGVKTPITHTAQAATATFTVSKTGSFVYYCSLPGHKAKGMWGTLVVQ